MSLIERAIDKLGATAPPPSASADYGPTPSGSTIERAAARMAVAAVSPPADVTVASPQRSELHRPTPAPSERREAPPVRIDLHTLRAHGFATPDGANHGASQEFRIIKRPLLANAFGRNAANVPNGRRVLVTSAMPGEGKSHCAINLALSIAAERDHQVLLVDADVAKPSLPRLLGIQTDAGLMDWLIDGTPDLAELVRPTNVEKLSVLCAGRRHEHATELLASEAMGQLLDEIAARYPDRLVIFDSPPLIVTTEARVLATYMGQVVMVVEAGRTSRDVVDEALGMLPKDQVVGLVLNKSREGGAGGYYGYQGQSYGSERD